MARFDNRERAGQELGYRIKSSRLEIRNGVVLGIPNGGMVVASEVANFLKLPLNVVLAKRVVLPEEGSKNLDMAVAAVNMSGKLVWTDVSWQQHPRFEEKKKKSFEELEEAMRVFDTDLEQLTDIVRGRTVIVVDDGIATGLTFVAALLPLRDMQPERIVTAVPVADPDAIDVIKEQFPEVEIITAARWVIGRDSIGKYYHSFAPVDQDYAASLITRR